MSNPTHRDHPILALSDNDFRSISLDVMMSWYGEADGGGSCTNDFGNKLINRWRAAKDTYCAGKHANIECHLIKQTRHAGHGDNLCVMHNVSVHLGLYGDDTVTRPVVQKYVDTKHDILPYIRFEKGFIQGQCVPDNGKWQPRFMPGWNVDWTTNAFQSLVASSEKGGSTLLSMPCDEWIDHRVLVVQRDTFANLFHDSEDFFNVVIAFAVLRWSFQHTQIYLTDLYPKGPFWDIWEKPFSGSYPVLDAWELRQKFGHNKSHRVCFKELAVGILGAASPICVASWETPCSRTALVRAYSDYVIRGMKLQSLTHYAEATPSQRITITYLARRSSSEWPEKKYCDDEKSFFLCSLWKNWGIRSLARTVDNDSQLVAELKQLEHGVYRNKARVKFQEVDYNIMTFEEQMKTNLQTDILIGPHGAGLMHNIFMRDRAVLIELSIDGSAAQRHFHNMARWYGRVYMGISCGNPIDVKALKAKVIQAIENINVENY